MTLHTKRVQGEAAVVKKEEDPACARCHALRTILIDVIPYLECARQTCADSAKDVPALMERINKELERL